ncbi:MAG: hypothetical protein Q9164_004523 [Protoblastenia rupestris]
MTTKLAAQLARIRANSTNPLNLKAQKKAHSQTLLFEPHVAATQEFDTIYQICYEGFEDLCRLDSRFIVFAKNLFSDQSKQEDRTQMTDAQNRQLDGVLECFLGLVGAKLLLKPALKAVEWLIRRFRVHEHNTLCLTMTFLPYHPTPIFPKMLSIMPQTVPPTLKFLCPYIESRANPPRHAVAHTATNSRPFLAALSSYVLQCCRSGHQYPTLISFWASITAEAVAGMCDQACSARLEAQKQNQEDIILFILPIVNEALSLGGILDLRTASYMILTVLAHKAHLDDTVLKAMMEAVVSDGARTSHAGLICLTVLAEQMRDIELPKRVLLALISLQRLDDDLVTLQNRYNVDKFTLLISLGIINELEKTCDESELRLLTSLLEARLMSSASCTTALRSLFMLTQRVALSSSAPSIVKGSIADLLLRLADSPIVGTQMQAMIRVSKPDIGQLKTDLQQVMQNAITIVKKLPAKVDMDGVEDVHDIEGFEEATAKIPTKTAYEISFLSHSDSYIFYSLEQAFKCFFLSPINLEKFLALPVLRKSLAISEPLYLSFFARLWCGTSDANVRAVAVRTVERYISREMPAADVQFLLPYILYGLSDVALSVRRAMGDLVLGLAPLYASAGETNATLSVVGHHQVYGSGEASRDVDWLPLEDVVRFFSDFLVPGLEECVLDPNHLSRLMVGNLVRSKDGRESRTTRKALRSSSRLAIFRCLCSHAVKTPLFSVKIRMLQMLNRIDRVGSTSRTKLLLPILSAVSEMADVQIDDICGREQIEITKFVDVAVRTVVSFDRDGVHALEGIIKDDGRKTYYLQRAAFKHLRTVWPSMKSDIQSMFAKTLFELGMSRSEDGLANVHGEEFVKTLATLPLSTPILNSLLDDLPTLSIESQSKPSASKRRRLSHGQSRQITHLSLEGGESAFRRISLVLELVQGSKIERHPELLKGLFRVFADLQHSHSQVEGGLGYLQVLMMDAMLAIIGRSGVSPDKKIDPSAIRTDVLIDCIRTTSSPQVRNTSLLLLSAIANVMPDLVIHSVMPVFTFMGSSILRQEDEYSSYVVKRTMDSIIPRLVQSLHKRSGSSLNGVSELLLSFATAFEHVPSHRRLHLYTSLINKVGPDTHLFAFLAILLDKYPRNRRVVQFASEITYQYNIKVQIEVIAQYLEVIRDAWKPKPTISATVLSLSGKQNSLAISINLLPLVPAILNNGLLISRTRRELVYGSSANAVRSSYEHALEHIFLLSETLNINKRFHILCMQALDSVLSLLPISALVDSFSKLLECTPDSTRQQVLHSFKRRLGDKVDVQSSQKSCFDFLPQLVAIIVNTANLSLKHIAINSIDRIVETFGKQDLDLVIDCAQVIASHHCMRAAETDIQIASLLCLVTVVEITGDAFTPLMPLAMPSAMDILEESVAPTTRNTTLHNAVYSFLVSILLYVPWMIKGGNIDRLMIASHRSASSALGMECDNARREALSLIAKSLEAKDCITALSRTWTGAMTEGPLAVNEHLEIVRLMIERQPKSTIIKQSDVLGDFFLKAFDLRHAEMSSQMKSQYGDVDIANIETAATGAAIAMVYKLNDAKFRPLFTRWMGWATTPLNQKNPRSSMLRRTTWYTFLLEFFDKLSSIVTGYASFIVNDASDILQNFSARDNDSILLWRRAIQTLHKTFEHDQDGFFQAPSHFTPVFNALISQLTYATQIPVQPEILPAIVELAVVADSSTHHKEINAAILKHMRSDKAAVRLAAVQCECMLTNRLGEEWLALLPEMLPFVSELQEDDDEVVEEETSRWIKIIEEILGENLNSMLQ